MAEKDLYRILGVARAASAAEIKKAYRKLARRFHPDVNPGSKEAEERFKEISEAHDILSDGEKRRLYDQFGTAGLQAGFDADRARAYEAAARQQERAGAGGFGRYANFEDLFGNIFGDTARAGPQAGIDTEAALEIDLLDAVRGVSTQVSIDRADPCSACAGTGRDRASELACPDCQGRGRLRLGKGPIDFARLCPRCKGSGRIASHPCGSCDGRGQIPRRERLTVHIPAGVDNGARVRVAGKGAAGSGGGPPGDLYIVIAIRPHPLLERRGSDLFLDIPVTVGEAMLGTNITVPTPDGDVRLKVPSGSQSGKQLRIRGHGVPALKGGERGDLYIRLMVHVPVRSSDLVRSAVETVEGAYDGDLRSTLRL